MVRTASTMLPLGTALPDFALRNVVDDQLVTPQSFAGSKGLLVIFMCNHCPFVLHLRQALADFAREYQPRGLAVVGISSNDVQAYPQDGPEQMRAEHARAGYTFPYLFDPTQETAKTFRAACTPDFFLFDTSRRLVYRGQFDDSRPKTDIPITGADLRAACNAVLAGKPVTPDQAPSIGCNIKWRPGNEPNYFTGAPA